MMNSIKNCEIMFLVSGNKSTIKKLIKKNKKSVMIQTPLINGYFFIE